MTDDSPAPDSSNDGERLARAALDGIGRAVVITDATGTVRYINRPARALLDVTRDRGGKIADLLGLETPLDDFVGPRPARVITHRVVHGDEELELEVSVGRPVDALGAPLGFFFVFHDLREENERSAERERLERLAAIGTMVAGFAHEVRNPVAALRSLAESLVEELTDAQVTVPHHLGRMLQVLERIERLVRTSLQFGRPPAPNRARHRPDALLDAAIGEIGPRLQGRGEGICVDVNDDLSDVFVDDGQIVQVLVILLNNALDSVISARRVHVQVREERAVDMVRFEVRDDGAGVLPENLGRIFDPFFTTKASGTGLGLSIAQQIVSENGGTIEVSSQRGLTVFAVRLPTPRA